MPNDQTELPIFENEDEERAFWATHDSTEYINWDAGELTVLSTLKPSTRAISLRLIANKRDIPYQSLIKIFLKERIDQELKAFTEGRDTFAAD